MAVDDMFDDREPKSCAAALAALLSFDSIETLGQARQGLPRQAGAKVCDPAR